MKKLLSVRDLNVDFKTKDGLLNAVHNININIAAKEIVCLLGESGSGKTVTSLALMRLIEYENGFITGGEVDFEDQNLVNLSQKQMSNLRGNKISMIFQDSINALDPLFPIGDQIMDVIKGHRNVSKKEAYTKAIDLLIKVKISDPEVRMKQYPYEFSGGMLQRIMIAIALAGQPNLLIADEATTALDVTIQAQILDLLKELRDSLDISILLITHDLGVTAEIADRVVVMYAGKIVEEGDVYQIFQAPRHPYTQGLIQSMKAYESSKNKLYTIKGNIPPLNNLPSGCRFVSRCPYATELCGKEEPSIRHEEGRSFSCWHPLREQQVQYIKNDDPVSEELPRKKEVLLRTKQLKKYFPIQKSLIKRNKSFIRAVDDISLTIYEGETFGLVGESGSGKSTLGRLIMQLEKPTYGDIQFNGMQILHQKGRELKKTKSEMQIVFQDPSASINPRWTLEQIIGEPLTVHKDIRGQERRNQIEEVLQLVGLDRKWSTKYPNQLSGGQKQRVNIARAIILKPKFILLDEAVSALDISVQSQIINLLKDLQNKFNITYLFITHGLNAARYITDRIGVMYLGQLVEVGPTQSIFEKPAHPYTRALLEANPIADPAVKGEFKPLMGEIPSPASPPSGCRFHTRCPFATERCKKEQPKMLMVNEDRGFACHYPLDIKN